MIYLCIRQTVDWADEDAFRAQLPPEFAPTVRMWNETFDMPYHSFRQRVREIALANAADLESVIAAPWSEIPDGALVLPADDDDWFAPDIAQTLEEAARRSPETRCFRWPETFLEVPLNFLHRIRLLERRLLGTPPKWLCSTNNYAIVKADETARLFASHVEASRWCEAHRRAVHEISPRQSVMNRTLASRTSLGMGAPRNARPISISGLLRKYWGYRTLYSKALPPETAWAAPYVRRMAELMGDLRLRARGGGQANS